MSRVTVTDAGRVYTVNVDDARAGGDVYQAVVIAQLVDELTSEPVRARARISSTVPARPKYAQDGVVGLAGVPRRLFPRLATQPYPVDVAFDVDGFLPLQVEPVPGLPMQSFLAQFAGIDLGPQALRRRPIALTVRTVELNLQNRPVALPNAVARISGIWRATRDVLSTAPPAAADFVACMPGLYASRPQPATTIQSITLTPAGDPIRRLLFDVAPGDTRIVVDRGGGLVATAVIGIDRGDADRVEHIEVLSVTAPTDPESPAIFDLRFALQRRHRASAPVERVTPTGPALLANLTDDGRPGDPTLFVNSVAAFAPNPTTVQISGGTAATEYATCARYRVTTNGEGYETFPPISRVAAVEVSAALGAKTSPPRRVSPDYLVFEHRVDLTLA